MATYVPPEWGVDGTNAFGISLEVIKSGVIVERLELPIDAKKSCVVAGRMDTVCDLVLQHPSISRVHAALQFDAHGALFLRDLTSTHGTFVNKQRVPANEFVRLHIGDVVVFGESTRLYALCGPQELLPAEYESQNLQQLREKSEQRQEKKALQRQQRASRSDSREPARDDSGASWGFREDAVDNDDDEDGSDDEDSSSARGKEQLPDYLRNLKDDDTTAYTSSVQASDVSEKDAKLFQQLQARIAKMANLTLEKTRIQAKQHQLTGLTDGQRQTLERNEQRIQALRKEIEDLEDRIHAKNAQRAKTKAGGAAKTTSRSRTRASDALYGYESDEDDFYDRTATNQRKHAARKTQLGVESSSSSADAATTPAASASSSSGALTAESIQLQITHLERSLQEVETAIDAAKAVAARDAGVQIQPAEDAEVDSLDSFMASTTHALHASELTALAQKREDVATELRRQRELLVVATPALARVAAPTARVSEAPLAAVAKEKEKEEPVAEKPEQEATVASTAPAPVTSPAPKRAAPSEARVEPSETAVTTTSSSGNAEKKTSPALAADDSASAQLKKRRVVGPARPPPQPTAPTTKSKPRTASRSDAVTTSTSTLEGGDSVWVPPANQTGDGRTALNDKFGY